MRLDPAVLASGVRLIARDAVGSTNTEALALARKGERGPLWITARSQSAGRGRRGRVWVSEPGNLYASLLLTDPSPPERAAELSFVASLAVHDAVASLAPQLSHPPLEGEGRIAKGNPGRGRLIPSRLAPLADLPLSGGGERWSGLALKWPNDVLIADKKFSGILIEGEGGSVVIGIGVNCVSHPRNATFSATDLAAAGIFAPVESLFEVLSATMMRRIAQWNRGDRFDAIRADWLARAAGVGKPMRVALGEGERSGRFETVDARGRLVLRLSDGANETITAGDVFALSTDRYSLAAAER